MILHLQDYIKDKNLANSGCAFCTYTDSHKMLSLRVQNLDYFFIFENVAYFEGRTSWQGFILHIGSDEEKATLLEDQTHNLSRPENTQPYLNQFRLYIIETANPELIIKIVCSSATVSSVDFRSEVFTGEL